MLERHDQQRPILNPRFLRVPFRIGHLGAAISQKCSEPITGNCQHAYVNLSCNDAFPQVNKIDRDQITSSRDLEFHANTHPSAVDGVAFHPVNVANDLLLPTALGFESRIKKLPNVSAAITIAFFKDLKLESSYKVAYLIDERP